MLSNLKAMIKRQAKNRNIRAVNRDVSEVWSKTETYKEYWDERLIALGKHVSTKEQLLKNIDNLRFRSNWAKKDPESRFTEMREVMKRRRENSAEAGEGRGKCRGLALGVGKATGPGSGLAMGKGKETGPGKGLALGRGKRGCKDKKPPKKTKRKHRKPKDKQPKPSPRPDTPDIPSEVITPPAPPVLESRPDIRGRAYDSKVGYFTSMNNIEYFSEQPIFTKDATIDIDLSSGENDRLMLKPGDTWTSEWYETNIIRGLDINVIGTHRINYLSNGSFEL